VLGLHSVAAECGGGDGGPEESWGAAGDGMGEGDVNEDRLFWIITLSS